MTLGMLASLTRAATHIPGTGQRIKWACAPRRSLLGSMTSRYSEFNFIGTPSPTHQSS